MFVLDNKNTVDEEIIKRNIFEIKRYEGITNYPYKDTKGIITVGCGLNVNKIGQYTLLNWIEKEANKKAPLLAIKKDYNSIKNAPVGNYRADFYQKYTCLRLSNAEINKQMTDHLKHDLKYIRHIIPTFNTLPSCLQDVILDIQYNTGHLERFPKFLNAIHHKDIDSMVKECHRKGISEQRNREMVQKILQVVNCKI